MTDKDHRLVTVRAIFADGIQGSQDEKEEILKGVRILLENPEASVIEVRLGDLGAGNPRRNVIVCKCSRRSK